MNDFLQSIYDKLLRLPKVIRGKDIYIKTDISCNHLTYGNTGAAWTFCPDFIDESAVIYSFGVGYDVSFDIELINNFDVKIHAFDPTPKSIKWVKKTKYAQTVYLARIRTGKFQRKNKISSTGKPGTYFSNNA